MIKLSPSQNTATATTVFGTSAYMAPEAFRGDISVKMDTFSFGVVLMELLTSLPPIDESREGTDLVRIFNTKCKNSFYPHRHPVSKEREMFALKLSQTALLR